MERGREMGTNEIKPNERSNEDMANPTLIMAGWTPSIPRKRHSLEYQGDDCSGGLHTCSSLPDLSLLLASGPDCHCEGVTDMVPAPLVSDRERGLCAGWPLNMGAEIREMRDNRSTPRLLLSWRHHELGSARPPRSEGPMEV